ncbi:Butanoate coenzyme A-transferase [bioreactor metagenome]|uniref:Butanoate coenzyme A-transferase n=1 Tax=bioreactor metagenome TaxID=1076179 RepID=A0A645CX80_9ZZZZ
MEGRGEFTPMAFSLQPRAVQSGIIPVDVYLGHVSPPDDEGYCTFGLSVDFARSCVENAKLKIVQVNRSMPRTCGETRVHVSELDYFVEADTPLYELPLIDSSDPVVDKIGANIADMIADGSTLQMGQGKIPNAILKCLTDKRDLGIHTEVFSDNLLPLIEAGIINGSKKTINQGKIISTFIQGTRRLYDFADGNDMIQLRPVSYTNHVGIIAQNDNMVAINSALQVDLTGQVAADGVGPRQYSGIGGQLDFIRGAAMAKNGKPIIALPATAKKGTVSRIVACHPAATPIATPRNDVFYVVTEYGVATLFGKCLRERAKALIHIAAPQFREDLEREFFEIYKKAGI